MSTTNLILYWSIIFLIVFGLDFYGRRSAPGKRRSDFSEGVFKSKGMVYLTLGCLSYDFQIVMIFSVLLAYLLFLAAIPLSVIELIRRVAQRKAVGYRPRLQPISSNPLWWVIAILVCLNMTPQFEYAAGSNLPNSFFGWPYHMLMVPPNPATYTNDPSPYEQLVSVTGLMLFLINAVHWVLITVVIVSGVEWLSVRRRLQGQ